MKKTYFVRIYFIDRTIILNEQAHSSPPPYPGPGPRQFSRPSIFAPRLQ